MTMDPAGLPPSLAPSPDTPAFSTSPGATCDTPAPTSAGAPLAAMQADLPPAVLDSPSTAAPGVPLAAMQEYLPPAVVVQRTPPPRPRELVALIAIVALAD